MAWTRLRLLGLALLLGTICGNACASPEVGWYWNPAESGRGFFIESKSGIIYLAGYFYEADGRATWLVAGGANADPYSYRGRLSRYSGGQTLFGQYVAPSGPADAGEVTLQFSDDRHASLTWPGGTIALQRDVFDNATASLQPETGWWWNPAESGRGYSIEVQGGTLFLVGFMYEAGGNPVWYFSAGPMATETHYEGSVLQFANGQTMSGTYKAPSSTPVGRLAIDFTSPTTAQLSFAGAGPSASGLAGITPSVVADSNPLRPLAEQVGPIAIEREFRYPQPYDPPRSFKGRFAMTVKTQTTLGDATTTVTQLIDVEDVNFVRSPETIPPPYIVAYAFFGSLEGQQLRVYVDYKSVAPDATCATKNDQRFPLPPATGNLQVDVRDGSIKGTLEMGGLPIALALECIDEDGHRWTGTALVVAPLDFAVSSSVQNDQVRGWYYVPLFNGGVRVEYFFFADR